MIHVVTGAQWGMKEKEKLLICSLKGSRYRTVSWRQQRWAYGHKFFGSFPLHLVPAECLRKRICASRRSRT